MIKRLQSIIPNKCFDYNRKLRTYSRIKANNLARYYKTFLATTCLWVLIFTVTSSTIYSFDNADDDASVNDRLDLSLTRLIDYLSYSYKGFDIHITEIAVSETFDDNVTLANENEREDFITDAGLGVGVKYEGKNRTLELIGSVTQRLFARNSNFDNTTEDVILSFQNEFSEYDRMSLNNFFTHSNEPLFFREDFFEEQFGRGGGRFEYFRNRFNIDYSRDITKQLTTIVRYDNYLDAFSGVDIEDSLLNKASVEADYLFSSATTALFSYDFTNRRFEGGNDASINTVTAGIRQYITKKLYFDGRTGLNFIDTFDDGNLTKPLYFASFTYQKDTDTIARLSFEKKNDTSPYVEDIFDRWKTTASVSRQLLERLWGSFSVFYGDGEYISSNFKTRLLGANSTLRYDITKYLKGNMTYTFSESDSNIETAGYTKNTFLLGLTAEF